MKLGILGGTFDPVHIGHLRVAVEAMEAFELDKVVLEVANRNPHKDRPATDGSIRAEMVAAAVVALEGVEVGTTELDRPPPSYAIDTLRAYATDGWDVRLIMGSDSLAGFDRWNDPEGILEICRLGVAARPGSGVSEAMRGLPPEWHGRIDVFGCSPLDLSASEIREKVRLGKSVRFLTPDIVVQIIDQRRLYV